MTDEEFLETAVSAVKFIAESSEKQIIGFKRADNFKNLYFSPYLLELSNLSEQEVLNKTVLLSTYGDDPNFEKIITEEDQAIVKSRESKVLLKVNQFKTGLVPYLCKKSPFINPETGNVVGILVQGFEIGLLSLNQHLKKSIHQKNSAQPHLENPNLPRLTKREKQVIFFFMSHLSSQEIADVLAQMESKKISKSTIDCVFNDQLYLKFEVGSRPALYKKLQALGYDRMIPKENLSVSSNFLEVMRVY